MGARLVPTSRSPRTAAPAGSVEPLWDSVRELYGVLRGVAQPALARSGLLLSEYRALSQCEHGPIPLKAITQALGVTPAATTDLVRRLHDRRLLRVVPDVDDRRSRLATLTAAGESLLRQARDSTRTALEELGIRISPAGRAGLLRGVAELRVALDDSRGV